MKDFYKKLLLKMKNTRFSQYKLNCLTVQQLDGSVKKKILKTKQDYIKLVIWPSLQPIENMSTRVEGLISTRKDSNPICHKMAHKLEESHQNLPSI